MNVIIEKRGTTLGVKDGAYQARHPEGEQIIPPSQVKSIILQPGTRLTHEAVMVALSYETEILFMDKRGFPLGRVWSPKFGSISTIRKQQALFGHTPEALEWVKHLLTRKLENQLVILALLPEWDYLHEQELKSDREVIERLRLKILSVEAEQLSEVAPQLRNLEARAGKRYWKAVSRSLPDPYRFDKRSRRPAEDMFNALMNYSYGMLYGIVEGALIQAGIDPYLGIFHRDEHNRPSLAFDFIERYRVWVEYVVIKLCMEQVIFIEFFDLSNGGFWLNAQGKQILIHSVNEYLGEIITLSGTQRSRREHIFREARSLAAQFKSSYSPTDSSTSS